MNDLRRQTKNCGDAVENLRDLQAQIKDLKIKLIYL